MKKFKFSIIYIKNNKFKHKQINSWDEECAFREFEELYPDVEVISANLGSINKEIWKELKEIEKEKNNEKK